MTQAVALAQQASTGVSQGFRNRIINGAMVIDQRYAGAATANTISGYTVDRWVVVQVSTTGKLIAQQNAGSVTPPVGFSNYLGVTSQSAYSVGAGEFYSITQSIEGYNVADLGWGTANAKTVTLSFWVRSSLTGTFGGALNNGGTRSYPFTYTISAANTWEQKSITIAGDTSGTWGTTNGQGVQIWLGLGVGSTYSGTAGAWVGANYLGATGATSVVGTNGATFYITGVQLEVGSTATSFDYRPYGTELMLCQRYFESSYNPGVAVGANSNIGGPYFSTTSDQSGNVVICVPYRVTKRTVPTQTFYTDSGTAGSWDFGRSGASGSCGITSFRNSQSYCLGYGNVGVNWSACYIYGHWTSSAEL